MQERNENEFFFAKSNVSPTLAPGCVHLTLNLLLGKQQAAALASHGLPLNRLLLDQPASGRAVAQLSRDAAVLPPALCGGQLPGGNSGGGGSGDPLASLDCSGWRLVVAGHGVGGGAAALLAPKLADLHLGGWTHWLL